MNSEIELHDSEVIAVEQSGGSLTVRFGLAYVHRSEGRPGIDPGSGWLQDLDLVISKALVESAFTVTPLRLSDGSLLVGGEVFDNTIPLPFDVRGDIRFSALADNGEWLVIQGARATVVPVGPARYLEEFPGAGPTAYDGRQPLAARPADLGLPVPGHLADGDRLPRDGAPSSRLCPGEG